MGFRIEVLPASITDCTACCNSLSDTIISSECIIGCTPIGVESLATAQLSCVLPSEDCEAGENFRLFGGSFINDDYFSCTEGEVVEFSASDLVVEGLGLSGDDCESCCGSLQDFDEEYSAVWSEVTCSSVCSSPESVSSCEGSTVDRLGCAHGYDLRHSGDSEVSFSLGSVSVVCANGVVSEVGVSSGNEEEGFPVYGFVLIGVFVTLLVVGVVVLLSRKPRRKFNPKDLKVVEDYEATEERVEMNPYVSAAEDEKNMRLTKANTMPSGSGGKLSENQNKSFEEIPKIGDIKLMAKGHSTSVSSRFQGIVRKAFKPKNKKSSFKKQNTVKEYKEQGITSNRKLNIGVVKAKDDDSDNRLDLDEDSVSEV